MAAVSKACGNMFGLLQGHSAETSGECTCRLWCTCEQERNFFRFSSTGNRLFPSGGLLIALPREQAAAFCKDIEKQEGYQAWIIGIVEKGNRSARIIDKPRVIEVPAKEKDGELW